MYSRIPIALLLSGLILGPLVLGSYYDAWRWPLIVVAWVAGLALILWPLKKSGERPNLNLWVMGGLVILLIAQGLWMWWNAHFDFTLKPTVHSNGIPWSLVPRNVPFPELPGASAQNEAWDRLTYIIPALLLVWGVARWTASKPAMIPWVAVTIHGTGLMVAILGLVFRWTDAVGPFWSVGVMGFIDKRETFHLFFGTYRSPGIATSYLNISLILGLSLALRHLYLVLKRRGTIGIAIVYFLSSFVVFGAVMAAGSKAGMALAFLSVMIWALMNGSVLKKLASSTSLLFPRSSVIERWLIGSSLMLILVLTGLACAGTTVLRWKEAIETQYSTMVARFSVNQCQIKMIQDQEWGAFGLGPGSFYPMFPYYAHGTNLTGVYYYAHNDHLQTLVEWGWLGFSAFAVLIGGSCWFLLRHSVSWKRSDDLSTSTKVMRRGLFIAIFICLIHATVDFPFQIESIAITIAVLIGLGWGCSTPSCLKRNTLPDS